MTVVANSLPRLLIVEDDEVTRHAYLSMLADEFIVETVSDGEHALINCERDYDLILMDIYLPGLSGIETAKQIRASKCKEKDIPIIGVSVDSNPKTQAACLKAGMNAFFAKPIFPGQVKKLIKLLVAANAKKSKPTEIKRYYLSSNYQSKYLTEREAQCAKRLIENKNNDTIAQELGLAVRSVDYYIKNMRKKLDVHTRADLVKIITNSDFVKYSDTIA